MSCCMVTFFALGFTSHFSHIGQSCHPSLNPMRLRSFSVLVFNNSMVCLCHEVLGAIESSKKFKMVSSVKVVLLLIL